MKTRERIIQVSWGSEPVQTYPVNVLIRAYDRSGLLSDRKTSCTT